MRFHGVFWPAFLMAGDVPLPKQIFAHGWLLFENDKMSKSRGNIVRTDPIREVMGIEALRYFLFREVVFGQDGGFSYDALVGRYNAELANGLGNLASRTLTMIKQYRDGVIPATVPEPDHALMGAGRNTISQAMRCYETFEFSKALEAIWSMLSGVDRFIVEKAPWKLARSTDEADQRRLNDALYSSAETLRIACALLHPIMPESTANIWAQLGMTRPLESLAINDLDWGQLPAGQPIGVIAGVFPRIEARSAIDRMRALEEAETARQARLLGKTVEVKEAAPQGTILPPSPKIDIEDFGKVDLRVGQVVTAERVKGADKLLRLTVDIGEPEPRTIMAGIALYYEPEKLIGRKVAIVANLHPRKLRGVESNGMIVAASLEGAPSIFLLDAQYNQLTLCQRDPSGVWRMVRNIKLPVSGFNGLQSAALGGTNVQSVAFLGQNAVAWMPLAGDVWEFTTLDGYDTPIKDGYLNDVVAGDLTGSGRKDLVFLETAKNYLDIVSFDSHHKLVPAIRWQVFEAHTFRGVANALPEPREALVTDVTGNGKNDLVVLVHDRILVYPQQ